MTKLEFLDYLSKVKALQDQMNKLSADLYELAFEAAAMTLEDTQKEGKEE